MEDFAARAAKSHGLPVLFACSATTMSDILDGRPSSELFALLHHRRTIHKLGKDAVFPDKLAVKILQEALLKTPSFFNAQTTRMVLLLGVDNRKLWDITARCVEAECGPAGLPKATAERFEAWGEANGTVLFYEDRQCFETLRADPALGRYANFYESWSDQTSAMHQYVVWSAFAAEGIGATIQHYNPLVDETVRKTWDINPEWTLVAQLVFGKKEGPPKEKTFKPLEERLFIHGQED